MNLKERDNIIYKRLAENDLKQISYEELREMYYNDQYNYYKRLPYLELFEEIEALGIDKASKILEGLNQ